MNTKPTLSVSDHGLWVCAPQGLFLPQSLQPTGPAGGVCGFNLLWPGVSTRYSVRLGMVILNMTNKVISSGYVIYYMPEVPSLCFFSPLSTPINK